MKNKSNSIIVKNLLKSVMLVMTMSMLISILGMMIDGIIIGRFLGADRTAAYGLVSPILIIGSLFSGLLSSGAVTQLSQYKTKGNNDAFNRLFSMALMEALIISILMIVVVWIFRYPISTFLGAAGDKAYLQEYMLQYIMGLLPAMPLILMMELLNHAVQLDGGKKLAIMGIFAMLIADVILDLANVYLFKMDMLGMALATTISYYASAAVILSHFFSKQCNIRFCLKKLPWHTTGRLIFKGLPGATSRLMSTLRSLCLNKILVAVADSIAVAAFSVNNSAGNIMTAIGNGVAGSCVMIAGIFLADRDSDSLKKLLKNALQYAVLFSLPIAVIFFVFSNQIAGLFLAGNQNAVNEAAMVLRYYAVYVPLYAVNSVFYSYLQGIQNVKYATIICAAGNGGFVIICAFVLGRLFGAGGVWMAFPVSGVLSIIFILALICIYQKRMPKTIDDFAFVPENMNLTDDTMIEMSVTDKEQITEFSEKVRNFCLERDGNAAKAYKCALCIEEILYNTMNYGTENIATPCIDTRVTLDKEDFVIRFRDNCRPFDPKNYFEKHNQIDTTEHIGIRMVFAHAKEIRYTSVIKQNNLIVRY